MAGNPATLVGECCLSVRGCSALRARADVFVALCFGNANGVAGVPRVVARANPALRSSTATRHACGLGWVLRTGAGSSNNRFRSWQARHGFVRWASIRLRWRIVFLVKHKADVVQMQTPAFGIFGRVQSISCPVFLKDNFQKLAHNHSRYFLAVKLL